jgi:diguanylate cyclase (GGDEF)-like protein
MSLATLVVFTTLGYFLGRSADHLIGQRRALRKANIRLRWLSDTDALTGLLNRRALHRQLRAEVKRARREQSTVALVLLDLDHFKQVNDRYGHPAGDRVLRRVGRCARRLARASDAIGRVGGEEFLAVLPATSLYEGWRFAERLRRTVGLPPADPATPTVTASLGVSICAPGDRIDIAAALRRVDRALYRAKSEGRNRVCTPPQDAHSSGRERGGSASIN